MKGYSSDISKVLSMKKSYNNLNWIDHAIKDSFFKHSKHVFSWTL